MEIPADYIEGDYGMTKAAIEFAVLAHKNRVAAEKHEQAGGLLKLARKHKAHSDGLLAAVYNRMLSGDLAVPAEHVE